MIFSVGLFYYLTGRWASVSVSPLIKSLDRRPVKTVYRNVFAWPGWNLRPGSMELIDAGAGTIFYGAKEGNWLLFYNFNSRSWLTVKGDFQISFRLVFANLRLDQDNVVIIYFYNSDQAKEANSGDRVFLRTFKGGSSILQAGELAGGGKVVESPKFLITNPANLTFKFENVDNQNPETVSLWDAQTNLQLAKIKLPFVFFKPNKKLTFGFNIGNAIDKLYVNEMKIEAKNPADITNGL